ncbi:peptidase [Prauserella marina]|nr:peptidase [Prauserella marina]
MFAAIGVLGTVGGVVGWSAALLLRGAARPATVSARWCALGVAASWSGVALRWAVSGLPGWWLPVPLAVTALAVPLALADLGHRRLPDVLTLPAYPILGAALCVAAVTGPEEGLAVRAMVGGAVFATAHLLVHAVAPNALGAGDVKLSGSLGGVLGATGWPALVVAAFAAAVVTLVLAGSAVLLRARRWREGVPHGPGMLAATCLIAVFPGSGWR